LLSAFLAGVLVTVLEVERVELAVDGREGVLGAEDFIDAEGRIDEGFLRAEDMVSN